MALCLNWLRVLRLRGFPLEETGRKKKVGTKDYRDYGSRYRTVLTLTRQQVFDKPKLHVGSFFPTLLLISRKSKIKMHRAAVTSVRRVERQGSRLFSGIRNGIEIVVRTLLIGSLAIGLAIVYAITRVTHKDAFPIILRRGIEFLGPIFIKFGQWISSRRDLFPKEVCNALAHLQRTAPEHSWMYTESQMHAAYGKNWRDAFVKFESNSPIGSGCCAQVYEAWLDVGARVQLSPDFRDTFAESTFDRFVRLYLLAEYRAHLVAFVNKMLGMGDGAWRIEETMYGKKLQRVAVKVLHPRIKEQLERDLSIMRGISKLVTYVVPRLQWLSLIDCIDEFATIMENQVNMMVEADNLMRFSKNFTDREDVLFPRPLLRYTRPEILVESYHDGSPVAEFINCEDLALQGKLARIGIKTILQMIFKDNFIHCDLHPGNILVEMRKRSERKPFAPLHRIFGWKGAMDPHHQPRLIILDCGLVASLSERCRQNLQDVFRSVVLGNGALAADYMMQHSSATPLDPDGFKSTVSDIVNAYHRTGHNLHKMNVSTVVTELFSAMVRHRVKQDGAFSSVILGVMVIEGLGRSLDPTVDIFAEVLPFLFGRASISFTVQ